MFVSPHTQICATCYAVLITTLMRFVTNLQRRGSQISVEHYHDVFYSGGSLRAAQQLSSLAKSNPLFRSHFPVTLNSTTRFSCGDLFKIVDRYGINGAYVLVPVKHWHKLSQIFGYKMMTLTDVNVTETIAALLFLTEQATRQKGTTNVGGFVHGALWYIASRSSLLLLDSPLVLKSMTYLENYEHGLGHGLVIRHGTHAAFPPCASHPNIESLQQVRDAISACRRASRWEFRAFCSSGAYHAWLEYFHAINTHKFPCWTMPMPTFCFTWAVAYPKFTFLDKYTLQSPGRLSSVCMDQPNSLTTAAACVWGITFVLLPLFHHVWFSSGLSSPQETCTKAGLQANTIPSIHCPAYFFSGSVMASAAARSQGLNSVDAWCSLLIPKLGKNNANVNVVEQRLSCEHAAMLHGHAFRFPASSASTVEQILFPHI